MNDCHRFFMPFDYKTLELELKRLKITENVYKYKINSTSKMLTNACAAPDCPHFLKLDSRLSSHRVCVNEIAAFCKTIYLKKTEENLETIFNAIIEG